MGVRVAQLVEHLTLDFGSGHDFMIMRSSPVLGSALGMESVWDSLLPSLSALFSLFLFLSLSLLFSVSLIYYY